jgi:hypothetical protein
MRRSADDGVARRERRLVQRLRRVREGDRMTRWPAHAAAYPPNLWAPTGRLIPRAQRIALARYRRGDWQHGAGQWYRFTLGTERSVLRKRMTHADAPLRPVTDRDAVTSQGAIQGWQGIPPQPPPNHGNVDNSGSVDKIGPKSAPAPWLSPEMELLYEDERWCFGYGW